ncbi:MAG: LysM repeat protein [Verrucomicrobiales bacterium]|jgi:LysM repeat protein
MGSSQLKILLAVFALGMLGAAGVFVAYMWEIKWKPEQQVVEELTKDKENVKRKKPDLGLKQYKFALDALKKHDIPGARVHLGFILDHYKDSAKYSDAKRILGELNVDELLSAEPGRGKVEYLVKSGDALTLIARRNQCTIDYIIRANAKSNDIIRIGEKLWVAPLMFVIEANITDKILTVYRLVEEPTDPAAPQVEEPDGETPAEPKLIEEFFTEYPILDVNIPGQVKIPLTTVISSRPALIESGIARFNQANYHLSHRFMHTKRVGILIQEMVDDLENATEDKRMGMLLSREDNREIYTYIRAGSVLRVVK